MFDRNVSVSRKLLSFSTALLAVFPVLVSAQEVAEEEEDVITMSVFSVDAVRTKVTVPPIRFPAHR